MNTRDFFIENIKAEIPRFEGVWKALPVEKLDWRPHERSKSAQELLASMAFEAICVPIALETGFIDFSKLQPPAATSVEELWSVFRHALEQASNIAAALSESDWNAPAKMMAGEDTAWETTRAWMAWGFLLDFIHHRGQLSVYIRPMGGKVPSIYGPSADTAM